MTAGTRQYQTVNTETLAATKTLTATDAKIQALDPGGAGRNVDLPDLGTEPVFAEFIIVNTADAAEVLTVRDAANSNATVATPTQNENARVIWDGSGAWRGAPGAAAES